MKGRIRLFGTLEQCHERYEIEISAQGGAMNIQQSSRGELDEGRLLLFTNIIHSNRLHN